MDNNKTRFYIHIRYTVCGETIDKTVSVTEEQYRAYKRSEWNEKKQKERNSRCKTISKSGKLVRCTEDCSTCKFFRSGSNMSLEKMQEDGFDHPDHNSNVEETIIYGELLDSLISDLDPENRMIFQEILDGIKDKDAAKELGISSPSTYNYKKQKLLKLLRKRLEDYDS